MSLSLVKVLAGSAFQAGIHSHLALRTWSQFGSLLLKRSSAQTYALVIGLALTALGIVGFLFYSSSFGKPGKVDDVFGVLAVNGWHNLVHLLSGLILLAAARSYGARARMRSRSARSTRRLRSGGS